MRIGSWPRFKFMKTQSRPLLKSTIWTIGAYGVSSTVRLGTNVLLARLLAPELFGTMLIVYSLKFGIELISDVGIGQNIVYSKNAENPEFYNTAWSLQLMRSIVLWAFFLAIAVPTAHFYRSPILIYVVPITGFGLIFSGFTSVSRALLQKRLQTAKLVSFDTTVSFLGSAGQVLLAYLSPTIWALAFGGLIGPAAAMIGSYFLLSDVRQRFYISKEFAWEILHFGKWIFLASFVYFLSTNYDRLYLAKVVPLQLLGVYGISRSISELLGQLVVQLGSYVLFPFVASHSHMPRDELRARLFSIRARYLLLAGFGFSILAATSDLAIRILYDQRYRAALWMLPILVIGSWSSILTNVNDAMLLGLGRPFYSAIANSTKFIFLLIGLPLSVHAYGIIGAVVFVGVADLWRYIPVLIGQRRERFSFGIQDLLITLAVISLIAFWEWLRWLSGFGTSFESLSQL